MKRFTLLFTSLSLLAASCATPSLADRYRGSDASARELTRELVARGPDALPELRGVLEDSDASVRYRARVAMGKITGQWGSEGALTWSRSIQDAQTAAAGVDMPLIVLHLFGNFDEEFC